MLHPAVAQCAVIGIPDLVWGERVHAAVVLRQGAVLDEDNFLFIVDRKKDMIISGGENIYCREVEEALLMHPAVAEVAVVGKPDPKWGESVVAVLVLKPGASADEAALTAHCRSQIAGYKCPKVYQFVDAMPRVQSTNKIDKRALRAPFWAGQDRQVS